MNFSNRIFQISRKRLLKLLFVLFGALMCISMLTSVPKAEAAIFPITMLLKVLGFRKNLEKMEKRFYNSGVQPIKARITMSPTTAEMTSVATTDILFVPGNSLSIVRVGRKAHILQPIIQSIKDFATAEQAAINDEDVNRIAQQLGFSQAGIQIRKARNHFEIRYSDSIFELVKTENLEISHLNKYDAVFESSPHIRQHLLAFTLVPTATQTNNQTVWHVHERAKYTLWDLMSKNYGKEVLIKLITDTLQGLKYLQSHGLRYRFIHSPSNIVTDNITNTTTEPVFKFVDFRYMAGDSYHSKTENSEREDIRLFGKLLAQLTNELSGLETSRRFVVTVRYSDKNGEYEYFECHDHLMIDFILECLDLTRPNVTVDSLLNHKFLNAKSNN